MSSSAPALPDTSEAAAIASTHPAGEKVLERGREIAAVLAELRLGEELQEAALWFPLLEAGIVDRRTLAKRSSQATADLAAQLDKLGRFVLPSGWRKDGRLDAQQADALRKMLLSSVADVRLVLVRLADQVCRLRAIKHAPKAEQRQVALETREIFAPLASRLGVWQIKWELEDLAFRYLEGETYQRVAKFLSERRGDREAYIRRAIEEIEAVLATHNIHGQVAGRPKHIYSIYKKMERKHLDFAELHDVRAVRVIVDSVADCYAALGAVHGKWPHIPGEFDDYIATPKENNYRSLHTAVVGPEKKTLEVQIRTREMHEHAELGVAAHWRYKEGGGGDDASFISKLSWLRSLLEPGEEDSEDLFERFKSAAFEDRIYALTPDGDVVDLPSGATSLDFAYHVHTDVGHRCRGAKVNGKMVPLTQHLQNGDQVSIITAREANPSRDWLIPQLGYLASGRARAKARNWFRRQDREHKRDQGQALYDREVSRLGVAAPHVSEMAKDFGYNSATDLYVALGGGDITTADIAGALERRAKPPDLPPLLAPTRKNRAPRSNDSDLRIAGVGDLLTNMAQCCKPVPPDTIAGYITQGRGITIHRDDCANMRRLLSRQPERVLEVAWSGVENRAFPVDVQIEAYDRRGLLKDISTLLAYEKVNILNVSFHSDTGTLEARMDLVLEIHNLSELSRVLSRLGQLSNVIDVRRVSK